MQITFQSAAMHMQKEATYPFYLMCDMFCSGMVDWSDDLSPV